MDKYEHKRSRPSPLATGRNKRNRSERLPQPTKTRGFGNRKQGHKKAGFKRALPLE